MRSAAKLDRKGSVVGVAVLRDLRMAHRHDADFVAIFLAEQCACAGSDRLFDGHQARGDRRILEDGAIGDILDPREFLGRDRLWMREIEAQPVGATSEPFCATWSPSTWRSASCSRCVAE